MTIQLYHRSSFYAFLLPTLLNFQGSTHLFGVGSFSNYNLSDAKFFDFLTTNLLLLPSNNGGVKSLTESLRSFIQDHTRQFRTLLKNYIRSYRKFKKIGDVIKVKELSNIVTSGIVLKDSEEKVLIVKRGNKVAVSSGVFAVSAASTIDKRDLTATDPCKHCIEREVLEELNFKIEAEFQQFVISKQKLQPAALYTATMSKPFKDLIDVIEQAPDFQEENTALFAIPVSEIPRLLWRYQFTDVSAYQLFKLWASNKNKIVARINWLFSIVRKIRIEDYSLL